VPIAPSTFYAARTRAPSARAVRDEELKPVIARVHKENYGVYGIRKMHAQLNREEDVAGLRSVARCTTQRLMKDLGLRGISRAKGPRTTVPGTGPDTRPDLVDRAFTADRPDQLWVADITYVRTFAGWVYCAFILDVFSRRIVGWQVSTSLRTDLALDALNMGLWTRAHDGHDTSALIHHSDRGVQYLAIRYTERLAEAGAVASVGSKGDSYDNAMAEAFNSLFKAELVRNRGPWKSIDDLEIAVAEYIDWFNFRRLHGEIGLVPPVEYETTHRSTTLPEQPAQRQLEASSKPGARHLAVQEILQGKIRGVPAVADGQGVRRVMVHLGEQRVDRDAVPGGVELRPPGDAVDVRGHALGRQCAELLAVPADRFRATGVGERPRFQLHFRRRPGGQHREVLGQVLPGSGEVHGQQARAEPGLLDALLIVEQQSQQQGPVRPPTSGRTAALR
jgi:putative transposase